MIMAGNIHRHNMARFYICCFYIYYQYVKPTSVAELSGEEIQVQAWSNTMAWDKHQALLITWDYEQGIMLLQTFLTVYTRFNQTMPTCFEYRHQWFQYDYPGGTGAPSRPCVAIYRRLLGTHAGIYTICV